MEYLRLPRYGAIGDGIAFAVDRSPQKDQARAVGYMNFAGCVPWVLDFWMGDGGFEKVFDIVGDPTVLAMMYTAAGVGWALCFAVRPFVATYLRMSADFRESRGLGRRGHRRTRRRGRSDKARSAKTG